VHLRRHLALLLSLTALGSTGAWASDIRCATTRQPAERVICDHAILNNEYDDISAQQQALLSSGKLSPQQLAQWRQSRNACTDVHCIDGVFTRWTAMARSIETTSRAVVGPAMALATDMAPAVPSSDAISLPASQASPTSEASLVRQGSAAGVALPQPVASQASLTAVVSAASSASGSRSATGMSTGLMAVVILAIACGAFVIRRTKSVRRNGEPTKHVRNKD
jgi:uncharacterized protein